MSTLNQAFIKAYQRRGVAAPHIPLPRPAPADRPTVDGPGQPLSSGPVRTLDQHVTTVPPAHIYKKTPLTARALNLPIDGAGPFHDTPADALPAFQPVTNSIASAAPTLSGPSHDDNPAEIAAPSIDDLRPAYEVERFEWPAIVDTLLERDETELGPLMAELLPSGRGTMLVTGCRRGEGRTCVALLLARHLSKAGARVLLVDADFSRPGIAERLATEAEVGWEAVLSRSSPSEAMIESLSDRLVILPLRQGAPEAVPLAPPTAWAAVRERWQAEFDVVCVDLGPFVEAGDSRHEMWFAHRPCEAAVVVRDVRNCRLEQSHAVGRKLVQRGASRWAIIENFV